MVAMPNGHHELGITESHQVAIFEDLMDSEALWLTHLTSRTSRLGHIPGAEMVK
jgi:hypothetical protein